MVWFLPMLKRLYYIILLLLLNSSGPLAAELAAQQTGNQTLDSYKSWIAAMKKQPRGPFSQVRWFCKDGQILPPQPFACEAFGGGSQHGQWSKQSEILRQQGYLIANVLADLPASYATLRVDDADALNQILLEQYLIDVDDGWIMRNARFYRGALQAEAEADGARRLLTALLADQDWYTRGFATIRIAAQILAHGVDTSSVREIRQFSSDLAGRDKGFIALRNKIHIRPAPEDAEAVLNYLHKVSDVSLRLDYLRLSALITDVYESHDLTKMLINFAGRIQVPSALAGRLRAGAVDLHSSDPAQRFHATALLMQELRDGLPLIADGIYRLRALDLSFQLEREHNVAASELRRQLPRMSRRKLTTLMASSAYAIYGSGLITQRLLLQVKDAVTQLSKQDPGVGRYKNTLNLLARMPDWSHQGLRFHFDESMQKMAAIEPAAKLFIQDQLRGSPLFFYVELLQRAVTDANQLLGVSSQLFGDRTGSGIRGLNPGLARGRLIDADRVQEPGRDDIVLVSETVADLPPVAGIITAGSGNPLSHIQLLARSMGIPNVVIDADLLPALKKHAGEQVQLAVSPAGTVQLQTWSAEAAGAGQAASRETNLIKPDLDKLDLTNRVLMPLSSLRASDSGVMVGPKAAKLAELQQHFPETVADGLVIPFGVFRGLLEQTMPGTDGSVFAWMEQQYAALRELPEDSVERQAATKAFRLRLQDWIEHADQGEDFYQQLSTAAEQVFGADGSYGVFVRSDTNVEDLPGFTGAGLNLTVPNVVGLAQIRQAISRVWASPFSERAFAWRQSQMTEPQHVYPAVLLLRSVAAEKSGVMVTADLQAQQAGWVSIVSNEGVGGAVDGQLAESLRVNRITGEVQILAEATATQRRILLAEGGIKKLPVLDRGQVLEASEIKQLIELTDLIPQRFPAILDAEGRPAPADVEFGFLRGRLHLFQIRPLVESRAASSNAYLQSLDADLQLKKAQLIDLDAIPDGSLYAQP